VKRLLNEQEDDTFNEINNDIFIFEKMFELIIEHLNNEFDNDIRDKTIEFYIKNIYKKGLSQKFKFFSEYAKIYYSISPIRIMNTIMLMYSYSTRNVKTLHKQQSLDEQPHNQNGEPLMTHQQYLNYSETSEPDYDDSEENYNEANNKSWFLKELSKNSILLESWGDNEYFIRCHKNIDFNINFINDDEIEMVISTEFKEKKKNFSYDDALNFILKHKNIFYTIEESKRERNSELRSSYNDHKINRSESGYA